MKVLSIVLSSITMLMLLSEMVCGLWLKTQGAPADSVNFHVSFGIGTVVMGLITLVVALIFIIRH